jgi:sulfite reductase beta subunit-like hemoprotein
VAAQSAQRRPVFTHPPHRPLPNVTRRHQVTLTANQNIILREIEPAWRDDIQRTLEVGRRRPMFASCP